MSSNILAHHQSIVSLENRHTHMQEMIQSSSTASQNCEFAKSESHEYNILASTMYATWINVFADVALKGQLKRTLIHKFGGDCPQCD